MGAKGVFHISIIGLMLIVFPERLLGQVDYAKNEMFQLSTPQIEVDSLLFVNSTTINVQKGIPNSKVFYQIEEKIKELSSPLELFNSTKVVIWAEHPEFQKSDVQEVQVVKISDALANAEIFIDKNPHSSYSGNGATTLIDLKKGTTNFRTGKKWLGFQEKSVDISLQFPKAITISKVQLGVLIDHGSWIFMPSSVEISSNGKTIGESSFANAANEDTSKSTFVTTTVKTGSYHDITLTVNALETIPEWHPGKGTPAWIFMDEILIAP